MTNPNYYRFPFNSKARNIYLIKTGDTPLFLCVVTPTLMIFLPMSTRCKKPLAIKFSVYLQPSPEQSFSHDHR